MPTITAITPQKKKDRFNIFLDSRFAFGASLYTIVEDDLKAGKDLDSSQIDKIVKKELGTKLMDLASRFLSVRPRSQKEVENYLTFKIAKSQNVKFNEAKKSILIPITVAKLQKYNYLSDLEFAKWYLESRLRSKPKGVRMIKIELKRKGISDEIIDEVFSSPIDETKLAGKLLEKKSKKWLASRSGQKLTKLELKKKVYQFLISRGFEYETIREAFANLEKKG